MAHFQLRPQLPDPTEQAPVMPSPMHELPLPTPYLGTHGGGPAGAGPFLGLYDGEDPSRRPGKMRLHRESLARLNHPQTDREDGTRIRGGSANCTPSIRGCY